MAGFRSKLKRLFRRKKPEATSSPPSPAATPPLPDTASTAVGKVQQPKHVPSPPPSVKSLPLPLIDDEEEDASPFSSLPPLEYVLQDEWVWWEDDGRGKGLWKVRWEGKELIVKGGKNVRREEGEWTAMARKLTRLSIIPQVYGIVTSGDSTYIYQQLLPGIRLDSSSISVNHSPEALQLIHNLRAIYRCIEGVKAPSSAVVGGFDGQNLHALSMTFEDCCFPSFPDSSSLEDWLKVQYLSGGEEPGSRPEEVWEIEVEPLFDASSPLVLTHGDFHPRNILVEGSQVTGLIDWELAGWYPPWVEKYCTVKEERFGNTAGDDGIVARALLGGEDKKEAYAGLLHVWEAFTSRPEGAGEEE